MIKWFTPFRFYRPADYENWLEDLAAQGYRPIIKQVSSMCMKFVKDQPKTYKYVADLQAFPQKDYFETYKSFGWEYVGRMSSMFIWRKEYTQEKPQSFSDAGSLAKCNNRFAKAISFSFIMCLLSSALLWTGFGVDMSADKESAVMLGVLGGLTVLAAFILLWVMLKIKGNNK